jgi:hypothetical protein
MHPAVQIVLIIAVTLIALAVLDSIDKHKKNK